LSHQPTDLRLACQVQQVAVRPLVA